MRWRWFVGIASLLAAQPALATDSVWREQSQKTVDVAGLTALEIYSPRGRVDLLPSPDGQLHITALKIVRAGSRARSQELAREIEVEAGRQADRYRVEVHYPQGRRIHIGLGDLFNFNTRRFSRDEVRIEARVPRGLAVMARASSGDIRSDGVEAPQVLKSTSGDVEVRSAGAPVEVSTSSGDVSAEGLRRARFSSTSGDLVLQQILGPLVATTSSGDITVRSAADSVTLSSVSGDLNTDSAPRGLRAESSSGGIVAHAVSGSVRVGSTSGDVTLGLRGPVLAVNVGTSSGDIHLDLDAKVHCALDLETSSGSLRVGLPLEMSHVSRRSLTGTIRGGSTPVSLRTTSGDITVSGEGQ